MSDYLLISDAAKEVQVESHVLRYWEEELHLPIKRNELGHRFYTREDVERFRQIKNMKERGLQLKAIKMILRDGRLDVIGGWDGMWCAGERQEERAESAEAGAPEKKAEGKAESAEAGAPEKQTERKAENAEAGAPEKKAEGKAENAGAGTLEKKAEKAGIGVPEKNWQMQVEDDWGEEPHMGIEVLESRDLHEVSNTQPEDRAKRLRWIIRQMMLEAVRENNEELVQNIKDSVIKELDYQFRMQEERAEVREKESQQRSEEYYRRMDELLRLKSRKIQKKTGWVRVENRMENSRAERNRTEGAENGRAERNRTEGAGKDRIEGERMDGLEKTDGGQKKEKWFLKIGFPAKRGE